MEKLWRQRRFNETLFSFVVKIRSLDQTVVLQSLSRIQLCNRMNCSTPGFPVQSCTRLAFPKCASKGHRFSGGINRSKMGNGFTIQRTWGSLCLTMLTFAAGLLRVFKVFTNSVNIWVNGCSVSQPLIYLRELVHCFPVYESWFTCHLFQGTFSESPDRPSPLQWRHLPRAPFNLLIIVSILSCNYLFLPLDCELLKGGTSSDSSFGFGTGNRIEWVDGEVNGWKDEWCFDGWVDGRMDDLWLGTWVDVWAWMDEMDEEIDGWENRWINDWDDELI